MAIRSSDHCSSSRPPTELDSQTWQIGIRIQIDSEIQIDWCHVSVALQMSEIHFWIYHGLWRIQWRDFQTAARCWLNTPPAHRRPWILPYYLNPKQSFLVCCVLHFCWHYIHVNDNSNIRIAVLQRRSIDGSNNLHKESTPWQSSSGTVKTQIIKYMI